MYKLVKMEYELTPEQEEKAALLRKPVGDYSIMQLAALQAFSEDFHRELEKMFAFRGCSADFATEGKLTVWMVKKVGVMLEKSS